jgi:hypothetical protein
LSIVLNDAVSPIGRVDDADAVGAAQLEAAVAADRLDLALELAARRAGFRESAGPCDGGGHAGRHAVAQHARYGFGPGPR